MPQPIVERLLQEVDHDDDPRFKPAALRRGRRSFRELDRLPALSNDSDGRADQAGQLSFGVQLWVFPRYRPSKADGWLVSAPEGGLVAAFELGIGV
jgi:hypothetical protein